jgi:hypothetical protein
MINVIAQFQTTLVSGISSTAAGGTLESNASADTDGATLPNGDYGIVIDEGNSRREYATITLTGFDFVFIKRGLSMIDGDTVKAGNQFSHRKGAVIKIVNHPVLTLMVRIFNGLLPVTGILYNDAARTYTSDYQYVDKKYVDDVAIAGGAKASETVYGISKLSSAAADPTAPVALNSEEVSAAGGTGAGEDKVIRANASGYIDKDFLEVTADKGIIFTGNALELEAGEGIVLDANGINVDVGVTDGKIVQMTTGDKLPAVDGSNLTNLVVAMATPSDNLRVSADTDRTTSSNSYVSVKKFTMPFSGSFRIKFDLFAQASYSSQARIYRNGIAIGTERTKTADGSYTTYSEDLLFASGDTLEIYYKGDGSGHAAYLKNARIYYDLGVQMPATGSTVLPLMVTD